MSSDTDSEYGFFRSHTKSRLPSAASAPPVGTRQTTSFITTNAVAPPLPLLSSPPAPVWIHPKPDQEEKDDEDSIMHEPEEEHRPSSRNSTETIDFEPFEFPPCEDEPAHEQARIRAEELALQGILMQLEALGKQLAQTNDSDKLQEAAIQALSPDFSSTFAQSYLALGPTPGLLASGDIAVEEWSDFDVWLSKQPQRTEDQPNPSQLGAEYARSIPRALRLFLLRKEGARPPTTAELSVMKVMAASVLKATIEAYGGCILSWLEYCDAKDIPPSQRLPADPKVVLEFLASKGGHLRAASIFKFNAALRLQHNIQGLKYEMNDEHLKALNKGLKNIQPPPKEKREPMELKHIRAFKKGMDPNSTSDVAILAAVSTAFFTCSRSGTVCTRDLNSFSDEYNVSTPNVKKVEATKDVPTHYTIHFPYDKVKGKQGRDAVLYPQIGLDDIDPVTVLEHHLAVNEPTSGVGLFAYQPKENPHGRRNLTKGWMIPHFNEVIVAQGLKPIHGHSCRIGGVTFFLTHHVDPMLVKSHGSWSSEAFMLYWRKQIAISSATMANMHLELEGDDQDDLETMDEEGIQEFKKVKEKKNKKKNGEEPPTKKKK